MVLVPGNIPVGIVASVLFDLDILVLLIGAESPLHLDFIPALVASIDRVSHDVPIRVHDNPVSV